MSPAVNLEAIMPETEAREARPRTITPEARLDRVAISLFRSRGFWIALALKLFAGAFLASTYLRDLFVPFLNYFALSGLKNPWAHFGAQGVWNAFPYPPLMLYIMAVPRVLMGPFLAGGQNTVDMAHLIVARIPIAAFDILTAWILAASYPDRLPRVLRFYWYSPLVFYVCYWHGQLDIIPTGLAVLTFYLLRQRRTMQAMIIMGAALAVKSHLWVVVPYLLVYIASGRGVRGALKAGAAMLGIYVAFLGPWLLDPAFRRMVFFSPEQARLVANQFSFGSGTAVLIAPCAICFLWFRFAAYEKKNWDLLMLYAGLLFGVFLLFAPPQPGYVLWTLPFIVHYLCRKPKAQMLPYLAFAASYLGFILLRSDSDLFDAWRAVSPAIASIPNPYHLLAGIDPGLATLADNMLFTVMEASLGGIMLYMYMMGVRGNIASRMRTTPVMIGVAGDSGSGKDTLARQLTRMFGERNVTVLAGDDYHRWERGHQQWKHFTHLDVAGNRLHEQQDHALALFMGESVRKISYDHGTGRFAPARDVDPNHVMIFQGLHSLSMPEIRRVYDLKIFLDPDEELRRTWKVRRDSVERGHDERHVRRALDDRSADRERFIIPQKQWADVIVRWRCLNAHAADSAAASDLMLEVIVLNSFNLTSLVEYLSLEPDLMIEHDPYLDSTQQVLRIRGHVHAEALHRIREMILPSDLWLRNSCALDDDLAGCLELILFLCLRERVRWSGQPVWLD